MHILDAALQEYDNLLIIIGRELVNISNNKNLELKNCLKMKDIYKEKGLIKSNLNLDGYCYFSLAIKEFLIDMPKLYNKPWVDIIKILLDKLSEEKIEELIILYRLRKGNL